jgi:hypothetical protein
MHLPSSNNRGADAALPRLHRISPQAYPPTQLSPTYTHVQSPSSLQHQSLLTPFPQHDQHTRPSQPISTGLLTTGWQRPRASSSYALETATVTFPEPQLHRATSTKAISSPRPPPSQYSRSDLGASLHVIPALSHRKSAPSFKPYSAEVVFMQSY